MPSAWEDLQPDGGRRARRAFRSALRVLWAPVPRAFRAIGVTSTRGLESCQACGGDMVAPIYWDPVDEERWAIRLRCGECGAAREAVASNAEVAEYEGALDAHQSAIERAVAQMDRLRMAEEIDCFVEALRRDLIDAADFSRRDVAPRRARGATA
jgi:hypothetical protein